MYTTFIFGEKDLIKLNFHYSKDFGGYICCSSIVDMGYLITITVFTYENHLKSLRKILRGFCDTFSISYNDGLLILHFAGRQKCVLHIILKHCT